MIAPAFDYIQHAYWPELLGSCAILKHHSM